MWPRSGKTWKNWNKLTRKEGDGNGGLSAFCFWEVPLRARTTGYLFNFPATLFLVQSYGLYEINPGFETSV